MAEMEVVRPRGHVVDRHPDVAVGIADRLVQTARAQLIEGHEEVVDAHEVLLVGRQVADAGVHVAVVGVQHL
jgi:hypothetical protein